MSNKINSKDFKLIERAENVRDTLIERSNIKNSFTFGDVLNHQRDLNKFKTELESQVRIAKATMDNIERNHQWVKDLNEEKLHHVWMYFENLDLANKSVAKLKEVDEQLERYAELLTVLETKFNLKNGETETEGTAE